MPTLDPLATFRRRIRPSLISASLVFSVVTSRLSVEADTTVLMDSKAIIPATAKNTIFFSVSLVGVTMMHNLHFVPSYILVNECSSLTS